MPIQSIDEVCKNKKPFYRRIFLWEGHILIWVHSWGLCLSLENWQPVINLNRRKSFESDFFPLIFAACPGPYWSSTTQNWRVVSPYFFYELGTAPCSTIHLITIIFLPNSKSIFSKPIFYLHVIKSNIGFIPIIFSANPWCRLAFSWRPHTLFLFFKRHLCTVTAQGQRIFCFSSSALSSYSLWEAASFFLIGRSVMQRRGQLACSPALFFVA